MELTDRHHFAAAPDEVIDVFADEAAVVARYEGMGHREVEVTSVERGEGTLTVVSRRVVDVDLPGFARKVLQPTNTMTQTDQWSQGPDGWTGSFAVDVAGAPVEMGGTMNLVAADGGSDYEVTITMSVKVPLVGGRIADWVGKNEAATTLRAEFAATDAWLADHPPA
jgi:hypothetical protein